MHVTQGIFQKQAICTFINKNLLNSVVLLILLVNKINLVLKYFNIKHIDLFCELNL